MDDLQQILGIRQTPEQALALTELARRSNDRIRVQNLLDDDYSVAWDTAGHGGYFMVPGKKKDIGYGPGQAVHPRYIAFKFFKELSQIILSAQMQEAIDKENNKRRDQGKDVMGKTLDDGKEGELHFVMKNNILPNKPDVLMELLPNIILGVEEEWGMNALPYKKQEDTIKWEKVNSIINRKYEAPKPKEAVK